MFKQYAHKVKIICHSWINFSTKSLNGLQRFKELCLIINILVAVFISLSLISFNPADPSWLQTSWNGQINNSGGVVGSWLADTLFFTFGIFAYTIPFLLLLMTFSWLQALKSDEPIDFMLWSTRLLGVTIMLLTSSALATLNFDDIWYFSSGGIIGDVLTSISLPILNTLGATVVFLFFWGAGFTLLTGISWLTIADLLGLVSIKIWQFAIKYLQNMWQETKTEGSNEFNSLNQKNDDPLLIDQDIPHLTHEGLNLQKKILSKYQIASIALSNYNITIFTQDLLEHDEILAFHHARADKKLIEPTNIFQDDTYAVGKVEEDIGQNISSANLSVIDNDKLRQEQSTHISMINDLNDNMQDNLPSLIAKEQETYIPSDPVILPVNVAKQTSDTYDQPFTIDIVSESSGDIGSYEEVKPELFKAQEIINAKPVLNVDEDALALQNLVTKYQAATLELQNPFLVKHEHDLPVPTEPLPTLDLLNQPPEQDNFIDTEQLEQTAHLLEIKLAEYKIKAKVVDFYPGPVITRFELELAPGVKASRISTLATDLARALSVLAVRVVEVIPFKPYIGIELPNLNRQTVYLSDVLSSQKFLDATSPTTVALGQDIAGEAVIADLSSMPHMLVAGTTGSGKSVGVNVMILSILYKASPKDVRFIMIDPKMLELSIYDGIPHLLTEVVTDMKEAANALRWSVGEMERRYRLMSALGVRNIDGFNEKLVMAAKAGHPIYDPLWEDTDNMAENRPLLEKLPYIVVVVDEFADLMMVAGKKVEELIARLAQKARAAGIHLILATQRPSVDVITGMIKANITTRIGFKVSNKIDSRTILDQSGAESLLGMGDMLYLSANTNQPVRVHGAFASDDDVHAVVNNWRARGKPKYISNIIAGEQTADSLLPGEQILPAEELDPLFDEVVEFVAQTRRVSASGIQRKFRLGFNRAARIVEQLEEQGIVSAPGHNSNREVLIPVPIN